MARKFKAGPDVAPNEIVRDTKGNVIDESYIERAVDEVHEVLGRGRPSLTKRGTVSPEVKARVPAELKQRLDEQARRQDKPISVLVREALERYLADAS